MNKQNIFKSFAWHAGALALMIFFAQYFHASLVGKLVCTAIYSGSLGILIYQYAKDSEESIVPHLIALFAAGLVMAFV